MFAAESRPPSPIAQSDGDGDGDGDGDLCYGCYRRPTIHGECSICGRTRDCRTLDRKTALACPTCMPCPQRACARCGRVRTVSANWPLGPVCRACYQAVLRTPAPCASCQTPRPLIGLDAAGAAICATCSGTELHIRCRQCDTEIYVYADGKCCACVLHERLTDLLTGPDGAIAPQLAMVVAALSQAERPLSVIRWIAHSPTARLLANLAGSGRPVSHTEIDKLPPSTGERYARYLLTHTGVIPARDDDIERVEVWLDSLLDGRHANHATTI